MASYETEVYDEETGMALCCVNDEGTCVFVKKCGPDDLEGAKDLVSAFASIVAKDVDPLEEKWQGEADPAAAYVEAGINAIAMSRGDGAAQIFADSAVSAAGKAFAEQANELGLDKEQTRVGFDERLLKYRGY